MALRTTIPMMIPIVLLSSLIGITTAQERQKEPPGSKPGNQESLRIDDSVAEVHYELAYALAQIPGRVPDAIAACRRMLLLKPDDEPGRKLLASLLEFQQSSGGKLRR